MKATIVHSNLTRTCKSIASIQLTLDRRFQNAYKADPQFAPNQISQDWIQDDCFWVHAVSKKRQVPSDPSLRQDLINDFHDSRINGHPGFRHTLQGISGLYHWPGLARDVKNYVTSCDVCQKTKPLTQAANGLMQSLPIPKAGWTDLTMDLISPLPTTPRGHSAICVVVDRLTKMVRIFPTKATVTAPQLAKLFFENVFRHHGLPRSIISDRDTKFTSQFWQTLFKTLGTKLAYSTASHPQTDGQTEHLNCTLIAALRAYINPHHTDWDTHIIPLEFAYNNTIQKSTGHSPFFLNYGHHPRTLVTLEGHVVVLAIHDFLQQLQNNLDQAKKQLQSAQGAQTLYANKKRRDASFKVGDLVLLSTKNLQPARNNHNLKVYAQIY